VRARLERAGGSTRLQPAPARPARQHYGPRAVSSFLPALTRKAFEKFGFASVALVTDWERIVGPEMAACSAPERLSWPRQPSGRAGQVPGERPAARLLLRVAGARAIDLQHQSRQLIERVNAYFGYRAVEEVRFVQGPVARNRDVAHEGREPPPPVADPSPCVASVADEGLRSALARLEARIRAHR
jgi:hypothetical protein